MKKLIIKSFVLLFCIGIVSCKDDDPIIVPTVNTPDFTVTTHDAGHPEITDGQVFTFSAFNDPAAEIGFDINNKTTSVSNYRIICEDIINTDGWDFELCFGLCYNGVTLGEKYPKSSDGTVITVQPGELQESVGNHFLNKNAGDGTETLEWKFKFIQTDADGNEIAGADTLSFTYRYNPS